MRLISIASVALIVGSLPMTGVAADFIAPDVARRSTYSALGIDCDRMHWDDVVVRVDRRAWYRGYPLCVERDRTYDRRPYYGYLGIDRKTRRLTQYREVPDRRYEAQ